MANGKWNMTPNCTKIDINIDDAILEITDVGRLYKERMKNAPELKEVDYYPSNISIGCVELLCLLCALIVIIILDISTYRQNFRFAKRNIQYYRKRRSNIVKPLSTVPN